MDASARADNAFYLDRQERRESNARSYPRRFPVALKSASGCIVTDVDGRSYLDCLAGAGTLALGHNHPEVIETLQQVLGSGLPLHTLDLTTPVKDRFVSDIFGTLPAGLRDEAKIQFCSPSGTDAVEAAIKLAKTATGRTDLVSFRGAYHGMSQGSLSLMGSLGPKASVGQLVPVRISFPTPMPIVAPLAVGATRLQPSPRSTSSARCVTPRGASTDRPRSFSKPCREKAASSPLRSNGCARSAA